MSTKSFRFEIAGLRMLKKDQRWNAYELFNEINIYF